MASQKKKRKQVKTQQQQTQPPGRHPDGDRRRRGGLTAKQAQADKRARHEFPGIQIDDPYSAGNRPATSG